MSKDYKIILIFELECKSKFNIHTKGIINMICLFVWEVQFSWAKTSPYVLLYISIFSINIFLQLDHLYLFVSIDKKYSIWWENEQLFELYLVINDSIERCIIKTKSNRGIDKKKLKSFYYSIVLW